MKEPYAGARFELAERPRAPANTWALLNLFYPRARRKEQAFTFSERDEARKDRTSTSTLASICRMVWRRSSTLRAIPLSITTCMSTSERLEHSGQCMQSC
jgi:hypothetical protein